ncbi:hypothetical protein [Streptomyces sp. NBC_00280]|uniref:hypothetical protein n=1 Tax=Streptomyces sp. NBC_00280 TaxID=2975699 RepID=UPI00325580F4
MSETRELLGTAGHRRVPRPSDSRPGRHTRRFEFYDAARSPDVALAIVTADTRTHANLLLTIGVRAERTLTPR